MSLDKFNELYMGVTLIINGQAPANATILTDDEMRNIKAKYHFEKVPHSYWIGGYYIHRYIKINVKIRMPWIYLQWVPTYKLFGWLTIRGHYEPRFGWRTINIGVTIRISIYIPRVKVTYYTYKVVRDNYDIPVYNSYQGNKISSAPKRLDYSKQMIFGTALFGLGYYFRQQVGITQGISQIYQGGESYLNHLNETGRGNEFLYSDPFFYINFPNYGNFVQG